MRQKAPSKAGSPYHAHSASRMTGWPSSFATRIFFGLRSPWTSASLVLRVVPQLLKHGRVIRPEIGITRVYQTEEGLLIAEMRRNGPAEKAGLRGPKITRSRRGLFVVERVDRSAADLIIAVDDQKVATAEDFLSYIEEKRPGEQVLLTLIRDGKRLQVDVPLVSAETQTALKE